MGKMKTVLGKGDIKKATCGALAMLFVEDELSLGAVGKSADKATGGALSRRIDFGFKGKKNEVERIAAPSKAPFGEVVLVGLGPRDKLELENYRQAAGTLVGALDKRKKIKINLELADPKRAGISIEDAARAITVGAMLRNYRYLEYKTKNNNEGPVDKLSIYGDSRPVSDGIKKGAVAAEAQCFARDLVYTPSAEMTPEDFVREARKVARSNNRFSIKVWKEADLKKSKMNAILAVGQGSKHPPRMVALSYQGARRARPDLVLVGKGVTFDSGGISIKPSQKMDEMKGDMTGAAEVLAAVYGAARLNLKVNVTAVIPLAENMPDGNAQRPGDVVRTASGTTVEVMNTDAEGRLILADALHYATGLKPAVGTVDVATLTGACSVALGSQAIGLMGNNEDLLGKVGAAALTSGERTWLLPLWDEYEELIESQVADIINTSTRREAGTIVGGMFLKHFVGDSPWAHLDIASVMWTPKAGPYLAAGPSAKGTRLLLSLIESLQ